MSGECDECSEHVVDCACNRAVLTHHCKEKYAMPAIDWIDIKDKLPDEDTEVLSYGEDKWYGCYCATYYDGRYFLWHDGGPIKRGVTHWMPLPAPPYHFNDSGEKVIK